MKPFLLLFCFTIAVWLLENCKTTATKPTNFSTEKPDPLAAERAKYVPTASDK